MNGVPETALQEECPDGSYWVKGARFCYQQTWKDGVLVSCINAANTPKLAQSEITLTSNDTPWAVPRRLDSEIKSPLTWSLISLSLLSLVLIWSAIGFGVAQWQKVSTEQEIERISDRLGPILAEQNTLRQTSSTTHTINQWQIEQGFLPESFASVVNSLASFGSWTPKLITWQNKTLGLEFTAKDIDIANLVQVLEAKDSIEQVTIRPHNAPDTWILEAAFL